MPQQPLKPPYVNQQWQPAGHCRKSHFGLEETVYFTRP